MKRESTNRIRYLLEEWLPPVLRDSAPLRWLFRRYWGTLIDELEDFRSRAHFVGEAEYSHVYAAIPRIHEGTDNSEACITQILAALGPGQIVDIGCGTGTMLDRMMKAKGTVGYSYSGVDIHIDPATRRKYEAVDFHEAFIESLPFADNSFDFVVCTHVLEHILDIRTAVTELRRICAGKLIVVVPKEREYLFTFNPHLHFFPYPHSFLRHMLPVPETAVCEQIGRDFFYFENVHGEAKRSS
ncbi:MAG: class I SAM-dependent methyltransferase [Woeseia sp.]